MCKYMRHSYEGYCGAGFIYMAADGDLYKIGCAKKEGVSRHVYKTAGILASVASRFYHLNKDHERNFKLLHVIYSPVCVRGFEKFLHKMFADRRPGKHEWFLLSEDDLAFLYTVSTFDGYELTHMGV